jgi:hypothetical protein
MTFPFLKTPLLPVPAREGAVVKGDYYRFTVLTEWLVRLEYDRSGLFEDRRTGIVVNRDFPQAKFILTEDAENIQIRTDYFELHS